MAKSQTSSSDETDAILGELKDDTQPRRPATEAEIEEKYDRGQASIVIQRNDFLVPNLLGMVDRKEVLNLFPPYQRRARWNDVKKSHLIESLLMNVPIPPVFLYETDLAQYEVMDGQQRLTTIRAFFNGEFKLKGLRKWPELNNRTYRELPPRIQAGLSRRGLAAVIILTESGKDAHTAAELRQYVFERLNTGGQPLNAQEVRNCLYAGHFNEMLVRISRSDAFTSIWGIPGKESGEPYRTSHGLQRNRLYSKMADCEIVLRYFALSNLSKFKGGMKRTLDDFMRRMLGVSASQSEDLEETYYRVLSVAQDIYGSTLFRLPHREQLKGRRSVPLADAVMLAVRDYLPERDGLVSRSERIKSDTLKLLQAPETYQLLVGRGNTRRTIQESIDSVRRLLDLALESPSEGR